MVRLDMHLADISAWVRIFDPRDSTLFVAVDDPPALGEPIRVDLVVGARGPKVILRGRVIARRAGDEGELPAGSSVALGPDEREKLNYLNGFVRGGLLNLRERRRLPVRLEVVYGGLDGPQQSHTRDINEEGVFVITEDPLPERSELHLRIRFPGADEPIAVTGVVSHTVVVEDEDVPGMGIRFAFASDQDAARFAERIDNLERSFLDGKLPDDCLV